MFDQSLSSFSSGCSCVIDAPLPRNVNVFKTRLLISGNIWKYLFLLCSALATYWRISSVWAQSILEPGLSMRIVWRPGPADCIHFIFWGYKQLLHYHPHPHPPHHTASASQTDYFYFNTQPPHIELCCVSKFRNQGECPYSTNITYYRGVNIHLA